MSSITNITPRNAMDIFIIANNIKNSLPTPLNKVYVSIGGKYNAQYVQLNRKTQTETNSVFQMLPGFIQYKETYDDDPCIVIVIDDFQNKTNIAENIGVLNTHQTQGAHIILCKQYCTETFITSFMESLLEFLKQSNIYKENFMICNYVKFLNEPNDFEKMSATVIPETIQHILNLEPNILYSECFYDWFGYNIHLYNYIYCYKLYRHNFMILQRLEQIITQIALNPATKISFRDYNETNYLDKIYDITGTGIDKYRLSMSLRDHFIANNHLEYRPRTSLQKV